jgi:hypothetical protein
MNSILSHAANKAYDDLRVDVATILHGSRIAWLINRGDLRDMMPDWFETIDPATKWCIDRGWSRIDTDERRVLFKLTWG